MHAVGQEELTAYLRAAWPRAMQVDVLDTAGRAARPLRRGQREKWVELNTRGDTIFLEGEHPLSFRVRVFSSSFSSLAFRSSCDLY